MFRHGYSLIPPTTSYTHGYTDGSAATRGGILLNWVGDTEKCDYSEIFSCHHLGLPRRNKDEEAEGL